MADNHSDLTVAFAFLAGALVGAGLALLLAPKPGAETRAQVGEWVQWMQEKAKEAAACCADEEEEEESAEIGKAGPEPV